MSSNILQFNRRYFSVAMLLLGVEILIARYLHDPIVRPYIGDLLVVILLYCLVKAFFNLSVWQAAISVLIFAFCIEILQYFHFVTRLGLQDSKMARIILGTSFAWMDLLAYTAGIGLVFWVEKRKL